MAILFFSSHWMTTIVSEVYRSLGYIWLFVDTSYPQKLVTRIFITMIILLPRLFYIIHNKSYTAYIVAIYTCSIDSRGRMYAYIVFHVAIISFLFRLENLSATKRKVIPQVTLVASCSATILVVLSVTASQSVIADISLLKWHCSHCT